MFRSTLGVLLCLYLPGALAQTLTERVERDEVVMVDSDDAAMNKAFARARAGLDNFLRDAASPSSTNTGHAVKVRLSDGNKTEYFWVGDVRQAGPDFTACAAATPPVSWHPRKSPRKRGRCCSESA